MCAVLLPPTSGGLSRMLSASVGGLRHVNHFATWGTGGPFLSLRACTLSCFTRDMLCGGRIWIDCDQAGHPSLRHSRCTHCVLIRESRF
jgi:hypothetical protein